MHRLTVSTGMSEKLDSFGTTLPFADLTAEKR
jgi:hypothetical protein